ncbi:MAG TPA: BrnA antitoxin family protein [Sphingomicrobium sp.]
MTESKENTDPSWDAPDEPPEWTDEVWDRAEFAIGGQVIRPATGTLTRAFTPAEIRARRGRPPLGDTAKVQQSLRLSKAVLDHFRATGPGWQARIDEVLRRHVAEAKAGERRVAEEREAWRSEEE